MTMRMTAPIPARVIQVLKDRLPAELDLIDAEESQAATEDVAADAFYEYRRPIVTAFPCIQIDVKGILPIWVHPDMSGTGQNQQLDAWYRMEVIASVSVDSGDDDAATLQRLGWTYAHAIFRVLCVKYESLATIADPVRFAHALEPDGEVRPDELAEYDGSMVRSWIVPIKVRRDEIRA